ISATGSLSAFTQPQRRPKGNCDKYCEDCKLVAKALSPNPTAVLINGVQLFGKERQRWIVIPPELTQNITTPRGATFFTNCWAERWPARRCWKWHFVHNSGSCPHFRRLISRCCCSIW